MWSDAVEILPDGSMILVREIKRALDGEDYKIIPKNENKQIDIPGCPDFICNHYIREFQWYKEFGLFHGSGPGNELPWYPDFLIYMSRVYSEIEAWQVRKSSGSGGSASPSDFGVQG